MGKFKRKYGYSSSRDLSSNFSNSDGNKSSQLLSSSSGNSCGSSLSDLSRNIGNKKFKCSSASQSSSNNCSQLSEIFAKYGYPIQSTENGQSTDRDNTNIKPAVTSQSSSNNSQLLLEFFTENSCYSTLSRKISQSSNRDERNAGKRLFQHSTPKQNISSDQFFDDPSYSESIKDHFSQLTQELIGEADVEHDNVNNETSQSDDLEHNSFSTSKEFIGLSDEFRFSKHLREHFSKDIHDLQISGTSIETEDLNYHNDSFLGEVFKLNSSFEKSANTNQQIERTQSQNNDMISSTSKEFINKSEGFEFSYNLNEHFDKNINNLQISETSIETEDLNYHNDSFLGEIFKLNSSFEKSANTNQQIERTQSQNNDMISSTSKEFINKSEGFEFSYNLNEHFDKNINNLQISETSIETEDLNYHNDSFLGEIFKLNSSFEKSANTKQQFEKTQSQNNDMISSTSKEFINKSEGFDFDKNINNPQISGTSTENEDINCHEDSFLDEICKVNQSSENSEPTIQKIVTTQSQSNFVKSNYLDNQQDCVTEHSENSNFEDYLKDISFDSSEKIGKIHLEDFDLDQEACSDDAPITSYNFLESNLVEQFSNSFSSEALSTGSKSNFDDAAKRLRAGLNHISKDKSLIYSGSNLVLDVNLSSHKKDFIKSKIEMILQWFTKSIIDNKPLVFKVRNNTKWSNSIFQNDVLKLKPLQESLLTEIRYANRHSRQNFNLMMYLLIKNYVLLQTDSFSTQREIYYQIKNFLNSQAQIRVAMNTISSMLNIEPWYFPIVSTSKGLVFGDLSIIISEDEIIHCNAFGGTLIPQDVTRICEFKSKAFFILVVEKDAIFKKLLDEDIPNKLTRPFIIVTGKGFPDINTRLFIKKLWMSLRIPVFILVDADPDGINIMLTYRFGSLSLAHVSEQLALPHIRWLGVFPSEIKKLKITHQTLNDTERNKIRDMYKRPYLNEKPWLKRELEILKENDIKAGIEGAIKSTAFLTDVYLPYKFYSRDYF